MKWSWQLPKNVWNLFVDFADISKLFPNFIGSTWDNFSIATLNIVKRSFVECQWMALFEAWTLKNIEAELK